MLAVGHWAVVLLVVAADEDCSLLVVNSTMGHRMYTKDWHCAEQVGDPGTTLWDNVLEFKGTRGSTLHSVRFFPTWYAFTPGQPIQKDCVTWGDRTYLIFRVGRRLSDDVRDEFLSGATKRSILLSRASAVIGDYIPKKLNFAFEGLAIFLFRRGAGFVRREVKLRFAQGHETGGGNDWWIGNSPDICYQNSSGRGFICGELGFYPWPPGSSIFKKPNNHRFKVYPRPI
ncbi:unnamed protein product [Symbiodinium microadriaticum]|nr:unnamed protein product [Symbiodinium microadriaticum]